MTLADTTTLNRTPRTAGPMSKQDSRTSSRRASLEAIPHRAEMFAGSGFLTGKSWSLAQVCEHLALAPFPLHTRRASFLVPSSPSTFLAQEHLPYSPAGFFLAVMGVVLKIVPRAISPLRLP